MNTAKISHAAAEAVGLVHQHRSASQARSPHDLGPEPAPAASAPLLQATGRRRSRSAKTDTGRLMAANDNTPAPFLTIPQVAARWQVNAKTVRRLIARGALAVHRIGGQIRIALADLVNYERLSRLAEAA